MAGAKTAQPSEERRTADAHAVRRGLALTLARMARFLWGGLRAGLVDTHGLPRDTRALLVLGYVGVVFCLALVLLGELLPGLFEGLPQRLISNQPGQVGSGLGRFGAIGDALGVLSQAEVRAIYPLMLAAVAVFVVGWALLLTGASDCGRRGFLLLVGLFGLYLQIVAGQSRFLEARGFLHILAALLVLVPIGLYVLTRRSPRWRQHPLPEFIAWMVVILLFLGAAVYQTSLGVPILFAEDADTWMRVFVSIGALGVGIVGVPFSVYLGLEPVNLAIEVGRSTAHRLRRRFAGPVFLRLAIVLLAVPTTGAALVAVRETVEMPGWWREPLVLFVDAIVIAPPFLLAAWALWRRRAGRWAVAEASLSAALAVGWVVWVMALLVAELTRGQDFLALTLAAPGAIPPSTLFVALFTYNVMTFGARYANREGRRAPRTGRALLYLGAAMLVLGTLLFVAAQRIPPSNTRNQALQETYDIGFVMGLYLLGPFYFAWRFWRHRDGLAEEEGSSHPPATGSAPS